MSKNSLDFAQSSMLFSSHFLHFKSVVCPSHLCRVRVTALLVRVESVTVKKFLSRVMTWSSRVESSQRRVTRTGESLRVINLQARVNVESNEISHFTYVVFCHEMAPNLL